MRFPFMALMWGWAGLTAVAGAPAFADGPAQDVPELKVLDRWGGEWVTTLKERGADAERVGEAKAEWVLDGHFLKQTWTLKADAAGPAMSGESFMTFDPEARVYRSWGFDSTGGATAATGRWDAASKTMTWTADNPQRTLKTTTTARFPEEGVERWTIVIEGKDGSIVADVEGTNRRRK